MSSSESDSVDHNVKFQWGANGVTVEGGGGGGGGRTSAVLAVLVPAELLHHLLLRDGGACKVGVAGKALKSFSNGGANARRSRLFPSSSTSSASMSQSMYPIMSSSICLLSCAFWSSPRATAFSLSLENSLCTRVERGVRRSPRPWPRPQTGTAATHPLSTPRTRLMMKKDPKMTSETK